MSQPSHFNDRPFNPTWRVPIPPEDDTCNKHPNLVVAIGLVGYGYQMDIYRDGKHVGTECRDFGGTYKVSKLEEVLLAGLLNGFDKATKGL